MSRLEPTVVRVLKPVQVQEKDQMLLTFAKKTLITPKSVGKKSVEYICIYECGTL